MSIFERTVVYDAAITFSCVAHELIERLPEGEHFLAEQLSLAAIQLPARIAENTLALDGVSDEDRAEARSSAHGVAARCAAILDLLGRQDEAAHEDLSRARRLLEEVAAMIPS